ncbi:MAG TPA: MBG domain-containing protein, partial [Niastella sp.]
MQTKGVLVTLVTLLLAITSIGQTIPTVYTDKLDYQPGEVVIIEGDGWRPGEQVKLEIDHSTITHGNTILYATADVNGHIRNDQFIIQSFHLGENFTLAATGLSSGLTATTTFTDANSFTSVITPTSINSGASGSFTIRVTNIGNGTGAASIRSIEIAIPSVFTGVATTGISTSANASSTFAFETSTGFTNGYNGSVIRCKAPTGGGLQGNVSPNPPYVDITFTATAPVMASATNYTLTSKASELTTYKFTSPDNVPIQKIGSVDQHPILTVNACVAPSVVSQPGAQTVTYGNDALFTFQTSNATYQWQESTNGGGAWNNISNGSVYSGVTTNSLSLIKPPASYSGYQYRCVASFCSPVKTTTSNAVTLTVNKANLTVTGDNKTKTYGEANPAFTVSYAGFVSGESATNLTTQPTASSAATAATGIGNYPIVPAGGVAANYSFSYVNGTLAIGTRAVTVTADAQSKTYGNADPGFTYQISTGTLVNGDAFAGALARNAGENVGTYAITQGTLALSANYALSYVGANLTISERAITVTAQAKNKIYGDDDPALTYTVTIGSLAYSDVFSGGLTRDAGNNVGTYAINKGSLALNANYTLSYVGADFSITERAITVTAQAKSKIYGEDDPALTYTVTVGSLAYSDAFSGGLTRDAGNNVGTFAINKGSLALNANYTLSYVGADFTITERAITVTAQAKSKVYGDDDPALTYTVTVGSLAYSDAFTGTLTRDAGENVGAYAIQKGTLALSSNYDLTYAGANLTIGTRAITV